MANPRQALEQLMLAALDAAKRAADRGDEVMLVAYVDVLDTGLEQATMYGVEFDSDELRNLDPYRLHERVKRNRS